MKKYYLLLVLSLHICILAQAQIYAGDTTGINNYRAFFSSNGTIAYNGNTRFFEIPANGGVHALFAGNLWAAGKDEDGNLHGAVNTFNRENYMQFGPRAVLRNGAYQLRYNKVWKVSRAEIERHILMYNSPGYSVPQDILNWPAHGNTANGEATMLAPFADLNNNNVYEPQTGEYPAIQGDEALYVIYNDGMLAPGAVAQINMGVEIHLMVYGYGNIYNLPYVNNTLFLSYKIINRSAGNYHDVLIGHWNDFDLGCFYNDRVGCDTVLNSFFVYNDNIPDPDCAGGKGYDTLRPALGVQFLNYPLHAFGYFISGATGMGFDTSLPTFYNYMDGFWRDGTPFTVGGSGYGGAIPTKYLLPGAPCDPDTATANWYDGYNGIPAGDRRALGSIGPFNLNAGETICVDLAYVFATSTNGNCMASAVDTLKKYMAQVQERYNYFGSPCPGAISGLPQTGEELDITIHPNPADAAISITLPASGNTILSVFNLAGQQVKVINTGAKQFTLPVADLPPGIYIMQVKAGNKTAVKRVVIAR